MSAEANATSLLSEFERIKGYRERGYCLSVTDQDRLIELVGVLSERIYTLTKRLKAVTDISPYPDFEDANGGCYWCGEKQEHHPKCDFILAQQEGSDGE